MRRSVFFAAALLALFTLDSARAAGAPFACGAGAGQTCYFRIYYARGVTRIVQLVAGTNATVPDVVIGQARYCVAVGKPPPPKCTQKAVNASNND